MDNQDVYVRFAGYVEYQPAQWHAEFIVFGDTRLPEGTQINWDTARALSLPVPEFPTLWGWRQQNRAKLQRLFDTLFTDIQNLTRPPFAEGQSGPWTLE